jgi:hypothetical protein
VVAVVANSVGDPQPVDARERRLRLSLDRGLKGGVGARAGSLQAACTHLGGEPAPFEARPFVEAAWSDDFTVYVMVADASAPWPVRIRWTRDDKICNLRAYTRTPRPARWMLHHGIRRRSKLGSAPDTTQELAQVNLRIQPSSTRKSAGMPARPGSTRYG